MGQLKTYQDYKNEYEKLLKKVKEQEDECAKKGISFEDMIAQTTDNRIQLSKISQEMRLLQDPVMQFGKQWKGEYYTLEEFVRTCEMDGFTDDDGFGYYATEKGKSDILIYPSDVIDGKVRTDFSHVIWFSQLHTKLKV